MPEPSTAPVITPPAPDLSGINATIDKLNTTLNEITERIDSVEEQVTAATKPAEPPKTDEDEWKPNKWSDIPKKSEEIAEDVVERKLQEKEQAEVDAKQAEADKQKAINDEFDKQLGELETSGKIPKVVDANNEDDPGRAARRELFGLGVHYESTNLTKLAELRETLSKQGYKYDTKAGKLIRTNSAPTYSQNAPIAGVNKSGSSETKPSYKDIHLKSADQLRREYLGED